MIIVGGESCIEVVLVRKLQYSGIVSHNRCAMRKGVATAIDSLANLDVNIVPSNRRRFRFYWLEISRLVRDIYARTIIYSNDIVIDTLGDHVSSDEIDRLLDCRRFSRFVFDILVGLVSTVENIPASLAEQDLIVFRIADLDLSGTPDIARV